MAKTPKKLGRPTLRTPELEEELLDRLAQGETLIEICRDDHMPQRTVVWDWCMKDEKFNDRYVQARMRQQESFADQIIIDAKDSSRDRLTIEHYDPRTGKKVREEQRGDTVPVLRHRLQSENKRWLMERLNAIYNSKQSMELSGSLEVTPIVIYGSKTTEPGKS